MKKILFAVLLFGKSSLLLAQGFAVNNTGAAADGSAMLDVSTTTKGALIPRMLLAQRTAIATPATGLLVYQTDALTGFYYNAGTPAVPNWIRLSAENYWTLNGTNIYNNNTGNVGIGNSNPAYLLDVSARMRLRHNVSTTETSGAWFNGSTNTERAFAGMENDNSFGLYGIGSGWSFTMNVNTGKVKIADGTQANGRVLTSDATGTASWTQLNSTQSVRIGSFGGGVNIPFADMGITPFPGTARYTTAQITLPPGRWVVMANLLVNGGAMPSGGGVWIRTYLSESTTIATGTSDIVPGTGSLISGGFSFSNVFSICSGQVFVNNTSGANKTYYLWCVVERNASVPAAFSIGAIGSSFWSENQLFAVPMN